MVSVREFPSCNYVLVVSTPFLCKHPAFVPPVSVVESCSLCVLCTASILVAGRYYAVLFVLHQTKAGQLKAIVVTHLNVSCDVVCAVGS